MSKFIMCEGILINFNNVNYIDTQRDKENDCFNIVVYFTNDQELELVSVADKTNSDDYLSHLLSYLNEKE